MYQQTWFRSSDTHLTPRHVQCCVHHYLRSTDQLRLVEWDGGREGPAVPEGAREIVDLNVSVCANVPGKLNTKYCHCNMTLNPQPANKTNAWTSLKLNNSSSVDRVECHPFPKVQSVQCGWWRTYLHHSNSRSDRTSTSVFPSPSSIPPPWDKQGHFNRVSLSDEYRKAPKFSKVPQNTCFYH